LETNYLFMALEGLVVFVAVACLATKDQVRSKLISVLLVLCTLLVVGVFSQSAIKRDKEGKSAAVMEAGQAEFLMRLAAAFQSIYEAMPVGNKLAGGSTNDQEEKLRKTAADSMQKAVEHDNSLKISFKDAVLLAEIGKKADFERRLAKIPEIREPQAAAAEKLLKELYIEHKLPSAEVEPALKLAGEMTDTGFFRDVVGLEVYKAAGGSHSKQYKSASEEFMERNRGYAMRIVAAMCVIILLGAAGTLTLFISLFFLPRKITSEAELAEITAPTYYGFTKIYGVFIGWLTLEVVLSPAVVMLVKALKGGIHDPVMTGFLTMVVYLVNNLPALFLAWFIAIKPTGVKFAEAVKLRLKTPKFGPIKLALLGYTTWLIAVPVILGCSFLAKKFIGAEGSSNPILTVVMQSTRGHDPLLTTVVFIFAIGVLPALCEETLFRGFLYTSLRCRCGALVSMIVSAFIFAAVHLDIGAFSQLFSLGFLFALIFERTRSLVPSMIAHCLWNSGTFILMMVLFGA
jgi:membrane protease YdiL (CAAX protease family)